MNALPGHPLPAVLATVLLALVVAACGADSSGDGESSSAEVAAPGTAATVCDGETVESAPAYQEGSATVAVYTDAGEGFELSPYSDLPESARALIPEEASVVLCMTVTDSMVVDTCEFEDDDTGEKFTQELADATYEGRAVVAATGEELFSETFEAKAGECGIIASFTPGEGTSAEYARPTEEVAKALQPYTG